MMAENMTGTAREGRRARPPLPRLRYCAALAALLAVLAAAPAARAETAVLRNGQRLAVNGYEHEGDRMLLHVAGGVVTVPADDIVRIEPEDAFPPNPPPPADPPLETSIRETAARHQLDPDLLASVIAVESGFDPRAVSSKNARGLMQLMPGTSDRLGVADVFDARQNLEAGARYLRELLDRYSQDTRLALAAYNAGPSRVDRLHMIPYIPETRLYVQRVLEQWRIRARKTAKAKSPRGAGFSLRAVNLDGPPT
ncbi:MAG TPA: lytic transglycosylase domain-containing protein [Candidatus Acidoferrales bacterium]|nr:lytic transglycosylase domain-containing protein [Candidatus Acidoferrales bacterium]